MRKILLSAFSCNPAKGSESANGWNWANELTRKGYEVHCFTREIGRKSIENVGEIKNLYFHYIKLPWGLESLYSRSQALMYVYYILWQWLLCKKAKSLHKKLSFDLAHHVSWANLQLGSFLYKLNIPFIFGPVGGGQMTPEVFRKFFFKYWKSEVTRKKISKLLQKFNPACKNAVRGARVVLISNDDTLKLAQKLGARQVELMLAATISDSFFPAVIPERTKNIKQLNLLWVGRFLPRKGILLVLEVMAVLKDYPDIILTVVGDGITRPEFLDTIDRLGLQKSVNWAGEVPYEKAKEFYATHDVFLFTSFRDSGPAQLVEAMAYGLPVVTINIHGQAQIVQQNTGIKCRIETVDSAIDELKKAVLIFYKDRQKLREFSQNAFAFAQQRRFSQIVSYITNRYYYEEFRGF